MKTACKLRLREGPSTGHFRTYPSQSRSVTGSRPYSRLTPPIAVSQVSVPIRGTTGGGAMQSGPIPETVARSVARPRGRIDESSTVTSSGSAWSRSRLIYFLAINGGSDCRFFITAPAGPSARNTETAGRQPDCSHRDARDERHRSQSPTGADAFLDGDLTRQNALRPQFRPRHTPRRRVAGAGPAGSPGRLPQRHSASLSRNQSWNAPMWCSLGTSTPPSR